MTAEQVSEPAAFAPDRKFAVSDYVAHVLRTIRRESDILARIGGDEFCVMVTENDDETTSLKERLADAFGDFNKTGDRPYRVSASIGLVQVPVSDTANVDELLARADELMYAEKTASPGSRLAG